MGLVAVLDEAKDVEVYASHPAHLEFVPPFLLVVILYIAVIVAG